jgi:phospholipid/cholesterol/gamma-HCH transport system substrate-binding protein
VAQTVYSRIRVGAVIAIGLSVLAFGIFSIGHGTRFLRRAQFIEAHFHRINGLAAGAPVTLAGVRIGAVDTIRFPEDPHADYVVVRMWILESASDRVHTDSVAQISSMGLLGDKFVELTPGTPEAPAAGPGAVLPARDPIDYEALLQGKTTGDLIANVIAISESMRSILDQIDKGHGILRELIRGSEDQQNQLTLASIQKTMTSVNRLSTDMEQMIARLNQGKGLAGALLSDKTNGERFLGNVQNAAVSLQSTSQRLDRLIARLDASQGTIPQLMENKQYAEQVLPNLRASAADLRDILHKINTSQGTLGMMVNDPTLYVELKALLANGGGWAFSFLRALYSVSHPFAEPAPQAPQAEPVLITPAEGASAAVPAHGAGSSDVAPPPQ